MEMTAEEWVCAMTRNHTFDGGSAYSKGNNNLVTSLKESLVLLDGSRRLHFPAGTPVCIYRRFMKHGSDVIAAIFGTDQQTVIRAGGGIKRSAYPTTGATSTSSRVYA